MRGHNKALNLLLQSKPFRFFLRPLQVQEMKMLGPFFAARVSHYLPSKIKSQVNLDDVRDSYERFFAVMSTLMGRGYPNAEVDLCPEEKLVVRRTFA